MGLASRIIPCLDVRSGRVVKGVQFVDIQDAGDPVEIAQKYDRQGADELVFLDITASYEDRQILVDIVEAVAAKVFIPLTVGGGIKTVADIKLMLDSGADKVAINSATIYDPELISAACAYFGSQCITIAIDAKQVSQNPNKWVVFTHGGRQKTAIDAVQWALQNTQTSTRIGAGEVLLTSMDKDGTQDGFDLALTKAVADIVDVPVIASGGVGNLSHLVDGIKKGGADAVLAASIFHFGTYSIQEAKRFMQNQDIEVRL